MKLQADKALDGLYRSVIMEHYRAPRHRGTLEGADLVAEGKNPLCGDEIRMELKFSDGRIHEVAFTGEGCAISLAAASIFSEMLEGRTRDEAKALIRHFTSFLKQERTGLDDEALEDLTALEGVSQFPARIKCALLPFTSLKQALQSDA